MRSFAQTIKRLAELGSKQTEVTLNAFGSADHDVIGALEAFSGDDLLSKRSKTALHSIADHGSADFFGDGETDAHRWVRIFAMTHEQDEAGRGRAFAAIGSKKIGPLLERA